jgi:RNA polymerase sigma factor (sigma-70 family)
MSLNEDLRALDEVASRLPFAVSDYQAVNDTFAAWLQTGSNEEYDRIILWLYCYTRRFLMTKAIRHREAASSDVETLISKAFMKSRDHLTSVRDPARFAGYMSVICKRIYIDHFRRRTSEKQRGGDLNNELDPDTEDGLAVVIDSLDREVLTDAIHHALEQIPQNWREALIKRHLEGWSYTRIATELGRPEGTLRAYVYKALCRLREDPVLQAFAEEWFE